MEELRVVVSKLYDWIANSSPPWATYHALMDCCLVALHKRLGVHPVGIRETVLHALTKLFMRSVGDQVKTVCGNHQLCTGI